MGTLFEGMSDKEVEDVLTEMILNEPDPPASDKERCAECFGPIEDGDATLVDYEDGSLIHAECAQ